MHVSASSAHPHWAHINCQDPPTKHNSRRHLVEGTLELALRWRLIDCYDSRKKKSTQDQLNDVICSEQLRLDRNQHRDRELKSATWENQDSFHDLVIGGCAFNNTACSSRWHTHIHIQTHTNGVCYYNTDQFKHTWCILNCLHNSLQNIGMGCDCQKKR